MNYGIFRKSICNKFHLCICHLCHLHHLFTSFPILLLRECAVPHTQLFSCYNLILTIQNIESQELLWVDVYATKLWEKARRIGFRIRLVCVVTSYD